MSSMQNSFSFSNFGQISLFVWAVIVQPAGAATFDIPVFPDSIQGAPTIVRGTIGVSHADWSKDAEAVVRLYTYYELQIKEVVKGPSKLSDFPSMMIRELGGEKEGVSMQITGTAQFSAGEDVVVFLKPVNPDNSYDVLGMSLGKYAVKTDDSGEEYLIGAATAPPPPHPGSRVPTWTFKQMKEEVRRQATGAPPTHQPPRGISTVVTEPKPSPAEKPSPTPSPDSSNSGSSWGWVLYGVLGALFLAGIFLLWHERKKRG